jgi:hypothetical protein
VFGRYSKDPAGQETCGSAWIDTILVQDDEAASVMLGDRAVLAAPRRIGDIFDTLCQTHNAGMDVIQRDVTAFLRTLIDKKLVRVIRRRDLP